MINNPPRSPKVARQTYVSLDGTTATLVNKVGDGSIIKRFDRTKPPQGDHDVVCPHFLELKWAYGCPFDCAWCYLKGTFRFLPSKTKPVVKDLDKTRLHIERFLEEETVPELLNSGELADSLLAEGTQYSLTRAAIPLFKRQSKHKLLLVTKSDDVGELLKMEAQSSVIVSFSLNATQVAEQWEHGAPSVSDRIRAAAKLAEAGYEVRLRIDPMVPVQAWQSAYEDLISEIFDHLRPSRITLGSLRGLQSTINNCTDKSWTPYLSERSNWGRKVDLATRIEMYRRIMERLARRHDFNHVALCKETLEVWSNLDLDYTRISCNCTL